MENVMKGFNKTFALVGISGLLAIPITSAAQDDYGFYVGASVNRLSADFEDTSDTRFDESDNAAGVRAGYMFNDFIGAEIGYLDLGSYSAEGKTSGTDINLNADGFTAAAIFNFSATPILDLYAKAGAFYLDADSTSRLDGRTTIIETDDGAEPFIGVGAEADFGQWAIFGEYTSVDTDVSELSLDIVSLGVKLEF